MSDNYSLFRKTTPEWLRLGVASVCAVAMLALNGPPFLRDAMAWAIVTPIQRSVHFAKTWVADHVIHSYRTQTLAVQNQELSGQNQHLSMQVQTLQRFEQENQELRAQLALKSSSTHPLIFAESLYQVVDPYMRKLVLNKGANDGVQLGQPVLNAEGLLGQITDVKSDSSELTLVTDTKVNIPVMVQRNPNERGFVSGHKNEGFLELRIFNQESADLQKDDVLVTSGLDGLFPAGLAVAKVTRIAPPGADGRSELTIEPISHTLSARYVGIVQLDNLGERKLRSDEQASKSRDNPIPATLGSRTREQFKK